MQLIDAGMIAFAAFHALHKRVAYPLTRQVPRMLRKLVTEANDGYTLFWNDDHLWKVDRWPPYRDRPEIWDQAGREDFDAMLEVLNGLGAVQYRAPTREADELLAAVAHVLEGTEPVVIRSDDKDFMQLLTPTTGMIGRVRKTVQASDVEGILGVTPEYVADLLALTGDKADGIPPILTPAPARKLISEYGHLRDWDVSEMDMSDGVREKLLAGEEQLALNYELVDLSAEAVGEPPAPIEAGWRDLDRVRAIGKRLDIGYLINSDLPKDFAVLWDWGQRTREHPLLAGPPTQP